MHSSVIAQRSDSVSFTARDLEKLLAQRGFTDISSDELIPEITRLVLAGKPA